MNQTHSPAALRQAMKRAAVESLNDVTAQGVTRYGMAAFEASEAVREACVDIVGASIALYTHPGDHEGIIQAFTERLRNVVELAREEGLRQRSTRTETVQ